jgi:hypothetical protein
MDLQGWIDSIVEDAIIDAAEEMGPLGITRIRRELEALGASDPHELDRLMARMAADPDGYCIVIDAAHMVLQEVERQIAEKLKAQGTTPKGHVARAVELKRRWLALDEPARHRIVEQAQATHPLSDANEPGFSDRYLAFWDFCYAAMELEIS